MAFCTKCGTEVPSDSAFCGKCGVARPSAAAAPDKSGSETPATPKRHRKLKAFALVVIGVSAVITIIGALTPTDDQRKGAVTPSISQAPSAAPSISDEDTATALYIVTIQDEAKRMGASLVKYSTLSAAPELTSDDWRQQVSEQLAIWHEIYKEAQGLKAPPAFDAAQNCWVAALGEADSSASDAQFGLDNMDAQRIDQAHDELARANTMLNSCVPLMQSAMASRK